MCFVNASTLWLRRPLVLPDVLLWWIPEPRIVDGGDVEVLGHSSDPGGDALLTSMVVRGYERDLEQ